MTYFFSHLRRYDWLLMGAVFLLLGIGLISLFSLSRGGSVFYFERQLVWVLLGLVGLVLVSFLDFRLFRNHSAVVLSFYLGTVLLLVLVLAGGFSVRGVEAWFKFGSVFFQPVEAAKLSLIILLAKFFSKRHVEIYRISHVIGSAFYAAVPVGLVLLQPDLGSAVILIIIWFLLVLFSGMKLRHLLLFCAFGIIFAAAGWFSILHPYQKSRISAFLNPYADPKGAGYQMIQSMIAVGSGKIWGKGLGYGSQSHLNFLPEAETDFIFAAFAEEWGFVGTSVFFLLLFLVIWRIIAIGVETSDNFSHLYAIGFGGMIFFQSIIHIGMNMGLLPITGITLPLVSYGGSSVVTLLIGIGMLQNIRVNARREIE
jgi:rod shape determining protein RodA